MITFIIFSLMMVAIALILVFSGLLQLLCYWQGVKDNAYYEYLNELQRKGLL